MSEVVLVVFLTLPLRHQNAKGLCCLDVSGACAANAPMNAPELQKIIDWLIDGARSAPSPPQLMVETGERLVRAGLLRPSAAEQIREDVRPPLIAPLLKIGLS